MENNKREKRETMDSFKAKIVVKSDKEKEKILDLKKRYENDDIFETDLSDDEMKALIELYEEEAKEIDQDIQMRKLHISRLLGKK